LLFACQVGHAYSVTSLLGTKEERLEQALWTAIYLVQEMANLLADLAERGGPDGREPGWPAARRRTGRLREHAARLRAILEDNEPVDLGDAAAVQRDDS
jgi:two-component system chemotaxis response regulator CheB